MNKSFIKRWKTCRDCGLCELAREHVIGYGSMPANVLFVGEAPGRQEDILGRPFVGASGKVLKEIILLSADLSSIGPESWDSVIIRMPFTFYITNVVACAPWMDDARTKLREPTKDEAEACSTRLDAIVDAVNPKTIVFVGSVSKNNFKPPKSIPTFAIVHPAHILRMRVPPVNTVIYHKTVQHLREHLNTVLSA